MPGRARLLRQQMAPEASSTAAAAPVGRVRGDNPGDCAVIAPNFKRRFTGVTATIVAVVPEQRRWWPVVAVGPNLPDSVPQISFLDLLRLGRSRPPGRPCRIWHARRNNEMLAGLLLKHVLRQRLRLVFTSSAQRRHTSWTRYLMSHMDAIISTSAYAAAYLDIPSTVVQHGVNTERYRPSPDRAAAWQATGFPGRYGIGVTGRIRPQKGTDLFIDAMCALLPRYPDFGAVVVGAAMPEHQGYLSDLKARVARAGLSDRVVFTGEVEGERVVRLYQALTIFVAPQRNEGFGLTPLEAMASGAAVVATGAGAFPALIRDQETGILVPTEDGPALTEAIEALMSDPERAGALGVAGRASVVESHSIQREAWAVGQVYERLWAQAP